ncbi:MAG TPA: hypothetical protein VIW67_22015, partial [Terriglobales bacterium]
FTVSTVPTGTTTGLDSADFLADPPPADDALPLEALPPLLGAAASPPALLPSPESDFLLHPKSTKHRHKVTAHKRDLIVFSPWPELRREAANALKL